MITTEQKKKILAAIAQNRANYPSDAKHATSLGISTSVYSMVKQGVLDKALSDANWVRIARRLGVNLRHEIEEACQYLHIPVHSETAGVSAALFSEYDSLR